MTEEKGLDPAVADKIGEYVNLKGGEDLLAKLQANETLVANESAKSGLADMATLFNYLNIFNVMPRISFDMSLARGLDYYTGVIYEVVTEGSAPASAPGAAPEGQKTQKSGKKDKKAAADDDDRSNDPSVGVGSVAAGGRYDELVGMFSGKKKIPCVGISFGVERIFSITKARMEAEKTAAAVRINEIDVFVMAFGGKGFTGLLPERMEVARTLWEAGIKTEFSWKVKPKLPQQFKQAETGGVPFAIILGEDELKDGKVKIKQMGLPEGHPEKDGVLIEKSSMVEDVRKRLADFNAANEAAEKAAQLSI